MTDNYLLPYRRVPPSTTEQERERDGGERDGSLSLCLRRKSIYTYNSGNALFVHTDTYAHVLRISINSDGENNTPGCQEIRLKSCNSVCECKCVCVHV